MQKYRERGLKKTVAVEEVARKFQIGRSTVKRLISNGPSTPKKPGRPKGRSRRLEALRAQSELLFLTQ